MRSFVVDSRVRVMIGVFIRSFMLRFVRVFAKLTDDQRRRDVAARCGAARRERRTTEGARKESERRAVYTPDNIIARYHLRCLG